MHRGQEQDTTALTLPYPAILSFEVEPFDQNYATKTNKNTMPQFALSTTLHGMLYSSYCGQITMSSAQLKLALYAMALYTSLTKMSCSQQLITYYPFLNQVKAPPPKKKKKL